MLRIFIAFVLLTIAAVGVALSDGNYEAFFRERSAAGTWGPYTRLSTTDTDTKYATVASNADYDPNYIVAVYKDDLDGDYDWYFSKSTDGGANWTPSAKAFDTDYDVELYAVSIGTAMDSDGVVHMAWGRKKTQCTLGPTGIYYARYDGASWSAPIPIKEDLAPSADIFLYTSDIIIGRNNIIHVAFGADYAVCWNNDGQMWYSKSTDGGVTWTTPVDINAFDWMDVGPRPSLAADDYGNLYFALDDDWYEGDPPGLLGEMYFRRSQNDGDTWGSQTIFGRSPIQGDDQYPRLMCDNAGGVYAVYSGNLLQALDFKYSLDHGSNWTPYTAGIRLVDGAPGSGGHHFAELDDSGFIHIVYRSAAAGIGEAYYMKIDTRGNIITPPEICTPDDGRDSRIQSLAVIDERVYIGVDEFVTIPPITLDIKPQSCPNPLNTKSVGVLPAAVLGTEGFDVTTVDPTTALLEGVARLRWDYEDVATPVDPGADPCDCTTEGADGYTDLTLKFDTQEIVTAMGGVHDGEIRVLTLTAMTYDGMAIEIRDCVKIIHKPRKRPKIPTRPVDGHGSMISLNLGVRSRVSLVIYDVLGHKVKTLVDGDMDAGSHAIHWNGKDEFGRSLASGVYFCRVKAEGVEHTVKMVLMK